ncbi:alpha/beta-hydrolase family protein [Pararhizobium sp. IMCC21322]|uniref:alpha/beta hydrolase n=1 Tax=Pararhizobium sp. IMCC21322 TaxID=3067903 RepID=UPI002740ADFC|nr:alpha/beta-hydrolase family protein [Pararhizobium sp. IMCC21322]
MGKKLLQSFSVLGTLFGLLFLCGSLTPSLLPRVPAVQGVLSGVALAVGYGVGKGVYFGWWLLEFKEISGPFKRISIWISTIALGLLTVFTFSRSVVWQNSVRQKMEMPDVESAYVWMVAGIALAVALLLILIVRGILRLVKLAIALLMRLVPRRTAIGLGSIIAVLLVFSLVNSFVVQRALLAADTLFATLDGVVSDGVEAPTHGFASGGPNSLVDWEDIGTNGKDFLVDGPGQAEIAAFTGREAWEPIRVYAGYSSGDNSEERAAIALQDLIKMGGFDRSVLIVATPTGTGWLDPAAIRPIAYLHGGDLAIVSTQYTYVPSWLSIMVEPDRSRLAARALFNEVFTYWTALPEDNRPKLYLFGLSLGALGSEAAADLMTLFSDPIDGALWSGPPFASTIWPQLVAGRNENSPAQLPEFRDGSLVRFMNQDKIATPAGASWGPMRLLYLQYASDPMVFFSTDLALQRPDWLGEDRGADLSEYFNWYPLVTFLQVGFDVPMATSTPSGYGHTYDALDYIKGWIEVTQPKNWTQADTERLNALFTDFSASPI